LSLIEIARLDEQWFHAGLVAVQRPPQLSAIAPLKPTWNQSAQELVELNIQIGAIPMNEMFAQGDLLIERVVDTEPSGRVLSADETGAIVLAEGEVTGHRHAIFDRVTMFRDDSLAREIPAGLYVGHLKVDSGSARIVHQEHAPITLPQGTYRVRRQRELEPKDAVIVAD
jgi:hypothetical protein